MKVKLIFEGKELEVDISEGELKKLKEKQLYKTGYEKVPDGQFYYYEADDGKADDYKEEWDYEVAEMGYEGANYYSDKTVCANNARADKLMRQLRRFAVEHRKNNIDYCTGGWCEILFDYEHQEMRIEEMYNHRYFGVIAFDSYDTAKLALDTFHDELVWYFTEYKDSL